ncbi:hypothetical protein FH972_021872 [Carpinus fangiana]|uniref:Uncharacterized protein n=1 Tax=Carpinus fangiana TaxID=176857 RepID=A0A5N6KQK1_9ROSI|nr:hypothetical protein FH972_021872 [Carpinus fangiana]
MLLQDVHDQARALGLGRIIQLWEAVSAKLFGATGSEAANAARPAPPASNSYVSSLLGRFSAPVTGPGAQSGSGADVLSMLGSAAAAAASSYAGQGGKRGVSGGARGFEAPPPEDARERKAWVAAQKERLREMIGEVERLEKDGDGSTSGFETIDRSEAAAGGVERRKTSGGGWGSYIWGGKKEDDGKGTSADLAYGDK